MQTAINATQFLLSQSDGALHNGAMNTRKLGWWTTVTFNGKTYRAGQLVDTLSSYNEGEAKGGPRSCNKRKHWSDGHDDDEDGKHKKQLQEQQEVRAQQVLLADLSSDRPSASSMKRRRGEGHLPPPVCLGIWPGGATNAGERLLTGGLGLMAFGTRAELGLTLALTLDVRGF